MTHITCRLTAKNRDHLRNPTLGSRVWATCTFTCIVNKVKNQSAAWVEGWANVWTDYMTQQWRVVFVGACLLDPAVSEPLVPATGRVRPREACWSPRPSRSPSSRRPARVRPPEACWSPRPSWTCRRSIAKRRPMSVLRDTTDAPHYTTHCGHTVHPFRRAPRSYYTHSCSAAVICSRSLR